MTLRSHLHIARFTLECETPLSVGTGGADGAFDVELVRDANGLPAIPGTAIAGVLRHLALTTHGEEWTDRLFGFQIKDQGRASIVEFSWGCIQDSRGAAVEGLLLGDAARRMEDDPLLRFAWHTADMPVVRERVRIHHRGAAAERAKFDRAVLPAGYRFSAEIAMWSGGGEEAGRDWERVLDLLTHPAMRLGGGTRAGLGALSVVEMHERAFDLEREREAFANLSRSVGETSGLHPRTSAARKPPRATVFRLRLEPRFFWRIGRGDVSLRSATGGKEADARPRVERRVVWREGKGALSGPDEWVVIPWSAIKGAVAHRVAFHANRHRKHFADELGGAVLEGYDKSESNDAVRELFGFARDDRNVSKAPSGMVGRLLANDVYIPLNRNNVALLSHNAIDRFTGGVRKHVLFNEEVLWKHPFDLNLMLLSSQGESSTAADQALELALNDLVSGRLPVGAGAADGHGFFDGSLTKEITREH